MDNFELPPIIAAKATCHTDGCNYGEQTLDIQMIEGSAVTCGSCWNVITDVVRS
jgi:hypothetical protein